jgi:hypothetical protein
MNGGGIGGEDAATVSIMVTKLFVLVGLDHWSRHADAKESVPAGDAAVFAMLWMRYEPAGRLILSDLQRKNTRRDEFAPGNERAG